ncbi:S-layer family protein, partial [Polynucleobacter sp. MWH-Tro8-2-5-gr]
GLTIGKATLTVNGVNTNVTYNGSAQTNSAASIVGRQGSDDFTISGYATGTNASNTAYADNLAVSPVTGTLASNYNVVYNNGGLTIGKANLNVTGNLIYNGTASVSASSLVATGVNGETFSISGTADLRSKNVQTNQQLAGVNGLVLSPNGSVLTSNYNPLSVANTHISVTPLSVSLTAPTINKVYDGSYNYTMTSSDLANLSSQLVGGDTVTTASVVFYSTPNTTSGKDVGFNKQVILLSAAISDGNNGSNYNVSLTPSTTSQITPSPLTIAAVNSAKFVGQITDPVGYSGVIYKGMVNGENPLTVLSGSPTYVRSDSSNNAVGSYVLTPTGYGSNGSTNGNYQITYQAATFTIVPAQYLIVSVAPTSSAYGSAPSYSLTAQYLPSTNATPVYLGTVGTNPSINPIPLTTSGTNPITVSDGAGGGATFSIAPSGATLSGSQNVIVGAYNIAANSFTPIGANFLGTQFIGSLTVTPKPLTGDQLGITGISRTYNGSSAIVGNTLNTNPTLSAVLSGDKVSVVGAGYFNDPNVGVNKTITLSVSLTGTSAGNDSGNYSLSSPQIISNTGAITQLSSVTYMGASGGNWSNASNWMGGAIPTLNNVANVVIPVGSTVIFDTPALTNLLPTSTITNNGALSFASASNFTLNNVISGTGSLNQSGAGTLTIAGANSYSGGTNINASNIIVDNPAALGSGPINSNGGTLSINAGVQLPSLTTNGAIRLATSVDSLNNQTYNGSVTLVGGNLMSLQSGSGNIVFNGGLLANNQQSLAISAPNGSVSFNNTVGTPNIDTQGNHIAYNSTYFQEHNIFTLNVAANTIFIRGNITTFGPQSYNGHVYIGDNGNNGRTRILLSEDPSIVFQKAVDDELANTHNLVVQAISTVAVAPNDPAYPFITYVGAVGALNPLASLISTTGVQKQTNALLTDISPDQTTRAGNINVLSTVNTAGNQTYTTNAMNLGDPLLPNAPQSFTTNGGVISFNLGAASGGGISSLAPVTFNLNGGSLVGLSSGAFNFEVNSGVTASPSLTLPIIREGITSGVLMSQIDLGKTLELIYTDGKGTSGAITVTSPDSSCSTDLDDCLKVNPL